MAGCVAVAPFSVPFSVAPSVQFVALWVALQSLFVPYCVVYYCCCVVYYCCGGSCHLKVSISVVCYGAG